MATCIGLVKSGGKNHGKICGRNTKDGKYCGYHRPKPQTDGRKTPKVLLSKNNLEKVESSREHFKNIEEHMIKTLDSKGMIFVWKCLCGKLVLSEDSVIMNRRDIFFGLGVKKSKRYKGCTVCHSLMCTECSLEDDSCKVCHSGSDPNWAEADQSRPVISKGAGSDDLGSSKKRGGNDDDLRRVQIELSSSPPRFKDVYRKVKSEVKFRRSRRQK